MLNTGVTEFLHANLCRSSRSLPCLDVGMLFVMRGDFSAEVIFPQCLADMGRDQGVFPSRTKSSDTNRTSNSESHLDNYLFLETLLVFISCFIVREHRVNL